MTYGNSFLWKYFFVIALVDKKGIISVFFKIYVEIQKVNLVNKIPTYKFEV